jgi:hypothetical protein
VKRSDSLRNKLKVNAEETFSQANGQNRKVTTNYANYLPKESEVRRHLNKQ